MTFRAPYPAQEIAPGLVRISGSFAPNGSSAIVATDNKGGGGAGQWTVAWTSTGLFTVTLGETFAAFDSIIATLQLTTGDDKFTQIGVTSVTNKTFQIRVWDVGAAAVADVTADAGNRINFTVTLRVSDVTT